jgi:hypothetical protein
LMGSSSQLQPWRPDPTGPASLGGRAL